MPDIPVNSPLGYVGIFLLLIGFFLVLAGIGILKVEKVTVSQGKKTWGFGIFLAVLGVGFLLPDIVKSLPDFSTATTPTVSLTPTSVAITSTATPTLTSTVILPDSVFQEEEGIVVMEAENFSSTIPGSGKAATITWQSTTGTDYSNGAALQALPLGKVNTGININGPALLYKINFEKMGKYYVYVRGSGPDNKHDSIHVGLGGNPVTAVTENGTGLGFQDTLSWEHKFCEDSQKDEDGIAQGCIRESATVIEVPGSGIYVLFVWMREDGVIVDKIVLSEHLIDSVLIKNRMQESQRGN